MSVESQHGVSDAELAAWVRAKGLAEVPTHRADLCLAIACARGHPAALAAFDAQYAPKIEQTARRFGDADFAAEVCQLVRRRLLLADGATPPRIAEYVGKGELSKFAQAVAARTALNLLDANARHAHVHGDDALLEVPAGTDNPEFAAIKLRYRDAFKQAFAAAMATLDPQLRTALRLHYLDGLTLGDLGVLYGWSVPTASRRLAAARAELLEKTRTLMTERLRLTPAELDSVLRLIESRLSIDALKPG